MKIHIILTHISKFIQLTGEPLGPQGLKIKWFNKGVRPQSQTITKCRKGAEYPHSNKAAYSSSNKVTLNFNYRLHYWKTAITILRITQKRRYKSMYKTNKKYNKQVKSNNFCCCQVRRALTKWRANILEN